MENSGLDTFRWWKKKKKEKYLGGKKERAVSRDKGADVTAAAIVPVEI